MKEEFIKLTGKQTGATSIVLVGVHGDEKCGIEALNKLLPNLKIEKGIVWFGYGNPRAIKANKRFTETNLNRMFKKEKMLSRKEKVSYEYKRAQFLKTYFNQVDVLLDIHASFTPNSKPFVICEANAKGIVEFLPIDLVVFGFDKVEPGGTDYYMNNIGKIGICLECGYMKDPQSIKMAEESIIAFLKAREHILNDLSPRKRSDKYIYQLYLTKTNDFTLSKQFNDFEEIEKDQLIGIDGDKEVYAKKKSFILFARNREQIGEEAFLLGEKKNSLA